MALAALERLRRRADFLRAAKGKRFYGRGFTLQVAARRATQQAPARKKTPAQVGALAAGCNEVRPPTSCGAQACEEGPRFGFTVTRQLGGAVQRNRIRRRLKEALRLMKPLPARPGYDYVIAARPEALGMDFQTLQAELARAFKKAFVLDSSPPIRHDQQGRAASREGNATRMGPTGRTPLGRTPKG